MKERKENLRQGFDAAADAEAADHERTRGNVRDQSRGTISTTGANTSRGFGKFSNVLLSTLLLTLLVEPIFTYMKTIDRLSLSSSDVVVVSVNTSSTHGHESSSDVVSVNTSSTHKHEIYPKRITQLDPSDNFSFVHISKCAGSTWIRLFESILKLSICPEREAGPEFSVFYQQKFFCKNADYTLISLRSPRHHVWSQFTMCKYSAWGVNKTRDDSEDFPRSGEESEDDEADFDSWLDHFVSMGNETNNHYNCYHPANFQTRSLISTNRYVHSGIGGFNPNMTHAMKTYEDLDFVALVEFVHESQCMLYYRLGNNAPPVVKSYLSKSCHCKHENQQKNGNGSVHIQHHKKGKRSSLRDLPRATLSKVANLTSADSFIYVNALKHFMNEMAWLESDDALGRRVMCDDALEKWERELAYLDGGSFSVTQLYRDAVLKQ